MSYGYLYRSLIIKGKLYFQLFKKGNFEYNDDIGTYIERFQKNYIFIPQEKNNNNDKLYSIYLDNGTETLLLKKNNDIMEEFYDKFHDFDKQRCDIIVNNIKENVWFQDQAIKKIITRFLINREIIKQQQSPKLLSNILLYGQNSTGKNSIVDFLKKEFETSTLFLDVSLELDLNVSLQSMFKQIAQCEDLEKVSKAVIIIRDDYDKIRESCEDVEIQDNPYIILENFVKQLSELVISIKENVVTFSNISFISIIETESNGIEGLYEMGVNDELFKCFDTLVETNELNKEQVKEIILKNPNSNLNKYMHILQKIGKKITIKGDFIEEIVDYGINVDGSLNFIYNIISQLIKNNWMNSNIALDSNKLKDILKDIIIEEDTNEIIETKSSIKKDVLDDFKTLVKKISYEVKKTIKCQDDQVNRIVYTVLRNQDVIKSNMSNKKKYIKNILLRGESGSGKTAIIECLCKSLNIPMVVVDATRYTEAGYIGADVSDMLVDLYLTANKNLINAQNGILVIDEIDKKAAGDDSRNDVSRASVLNGLLKIIEGTKLTLNIKKSAFDNESIVFDTSNLTIICCGAFEKIEEMRDKRIGHRTIGFGEIANNIQDNEINDDDYVKYGMSRQFMARFPVIINLAKLNINCLKEIITTSNTSELLLQKDLFLLNGIDVEYQEDFLDKIASIAYNKNIGARGIEKAFQEVLTKVNIHDIVLGDCKKIIFDANCIDNPDELIVISNANVKKLTI